MFFHFHFSLSILLISTVGFLLESCKLCCFFGFNQVFDTRTIILESTVSSFLIIFPIVFNKHCADVVAHWKDIDLYVFKHPMI